MSSYVIVQDIEIEGRAFKAGEVIGKRDGGVIVATAEGVTRGHIEARLNRSVRCGDPKKIMAELSKSDDGDKKQSKQGKDDGKTETANK